MHFYIGGGSLKPVYFVIYKMKFTNTISSIFRECTLVTGRAGGIFLGGDPSEFGTPPKTQ